LGEIEEVRNQIPLLVEESSLSASVDWKHQQQGHGDGCR
jgi:hypothetical protein